MMILTWEEARKETNLDHVEDSNPLSKFCQNKAKLNTDSLIHSFLLFLNVIIFFICFLKF